MDHHTSWLSFLPGYSSLQHHMNAHYGHTAVLGNGISTVHHVYAALVVFLILAGMSLYARGKVGNVEAALVPPRSFGVVAFFELFFETLLSLMEGVIGHTYKRYIPLIGTLGLFILISNLMGLIPGMLPATDNLNTTFACGVIVFCYFNFHGLRAHGIGHITHLMFPAGTGVLGWILMPLLFPIELLALFVRPVTLGIRLAANMIGDHAVLLGFAGVMPLLIPLPFYVLGLLVCVIQTVVFCILSCVYISLHTAEAEH